MTIEQVVSAANEFGVPADRIADIEEKLRRWHNESKPLHVNCGRGGKGCISGRTYRYFFDVQYHVADGSRDWDNGKYWVVHQWN